MEKVIKSRRIRRFGIVLLVSFPGIFAFLHLGPTLGFDKTPKNLSSLKLSDGSQLVLFQKRKDGFLEAYTTMLCRIYPEGHAEVITIGYEDSYWWLAKLHPIQNGTQIEIRAWGVRAAVYDSDLSLVSWPGEKFSPARAILVSATELNLMLNTFR